MRGFFTLSPDGKLTGWRHADMGASKPEHVFFDKSKYKKWWPVDTRIRINCIQILLEAIGEGLIQSELQYWASSWNLTEADWLVYASRAGIDIIKKKDGTYRAQYLPKGSFTGYRAAGKDYFEAIVNLWKLVTSPEPGKTLPPDGLTEQIEKEINPFQGAIDAYNDLASDADVDDPSEENDTQEGGKNG